MFTEQEVRDTLAKLEKYRERACIVADTVSKLRKTNVPISVSVTSDGIEYEYNDACNCHPEYAGTVIPLEYLWLENYAEIEGARLKREAEAMAEAKRQEEESRRKKEAEDREKRDRKEYERLKKKYSPE
jgi:hypothetical protein